MMTLPMQGIPLSDEYSDTQKACAKKIDLNSQKVLIEQQLKASFTESELNKLTDFYSKKETQKVLDFGREQFMQHNGIQLKQAMVEPSEEEMQAVANFTETPLGKKYNQFLVAHDNGSANQQVTNFLMQELKKCGFSEK